MISLGLAVRNQRYALAVALVAAGVGAGLVADLLFNSNASLMLCLFAVNAAARFGGRGPGLAVTALGVLAADYFFVDPRYSFAVASAASLGPLLLIAGSGVACSLWPNTAPAQGMPAPRFADRAGHADHRRPWPVRRPWLLGGALLAFLLLVGVLELDFLEDARYQQWVGHTYEVLNEERGLLSALERAGSAERGYLLSGNSGYLASLQAGLRTAELARRSLRRLTVDNPPQQARLDTVDRLVTARLAEIQQTIRLKEQGAGSAALLSFEQNGSRNLMQQCRAVLSAFEGEEGLLLGARAAQVAFEVKRTHWVLGLGSGSILILLVSAALVIERDIQEREQSRRLAGQREEHLRLALTAANAGAWEWNVRTNDNVWSHELWTLYGLSPDRVTPSYEAWLQVVHPEDRERAARTVLDAARAESDINLEFRVAVADGHPRWLLAKARLLRDEEGKPARYLGIAMDITLRKQAEEALREREENLRRFTEAAPVAIAMFDTSMRYLAASQRLRDDYGLGDQALTGRSVYDVFPDTPQHWREIHQRCLAGALERCPGERFERAGGAEQWIRWEIQPWRRADGEIGGVVLFSEDITTSRRAEEEVRQLNAELERRVQERTSQFEAANKELETFAYTVSHDLRAPLRGIDGWGLALLEDYGSQLEQRAQQYLHRVRSETQRMGALIDDLLHLSRIGRTEMFHSTVDLSELARLVVGRLSESHAGRAITFVIQPGLTAEGDAGLVEIVLTNLLSNAVKFTGPRADARIEFGGTEHGGTRAFYVRDNGVGFDQAHAGKLFGAFQRLHRASEFPGTGIGLATVQRVIHRHGGRVWVEAELGKGAAFYFTLGAA